MCEVGATIETEAQPGRGRPGGRFGPVGRFGRSKEAMSRVLPMTSPKRPPGGGVRRGRIVHWTILNPTSPLTGRAGRSGWTGQHGKTDA